jgi:hypothetical protein
MSIRYVDWPGENPNPPFPYIKKYQRIRLKKQMPESLDGSDATTSFLGHVSQKTDFGTLLVTYFEASGKEGPAEVLSSLRKGLNDNNKYRLTSLCSLLVSRRVRGHPVTADDLDIDGIDLVVYRQPAREGSTLCVIERDIPSVEAALWRLQKEMLGEKRSYSVLPLGTPPDSVISIIEMLSRYKEELGITPPQMGRILKANHPHVNRMVYVDSKYGGQRLLFKSSVQEFIAAVQATEEYKGYEIKNRAKRTYPRQERLVDEEIILGTLPKGRRSATRGKL